jgi:hypothetical protein
MDWVIQTADISFSQFLRLGQGKIKALVISVPAESSSWHADRGLLEVIFPRTLEQRIGHGSKKGTNPIHEGYNLMA